MSEQLSVSPRSMDILPDQLASFVQELHPCCKEVMTMTPLLEGHHNKIYLCQDGPTCFPEQFVVRHPKCPEAWAAMDATDYMARDELLAGLRVPRVLYVGRMSDGTPVMFEEFVDGVHKDLNSLNNRETKTLADAVYEVHNHRKSAHFSGTSGSEPNRSGNYADYLWAMVDESVDKRLEAVDMAPYAAARDAIEAGKQRLADMIAASDAFDGNAFCLLHRDLSHGNMLWPSSGAVFFIDWNSTFGDPADDLDYLCTDNGICDPIKQKLLAAYRRAAGPEADEIFARLDAYTLKNRLDDMAWVIMMQEVYGDQYQEPCQQRLVALQGLLAA